MVALSGVYQSYVRSHDQCFPVGTMRLDAVES